MRSIHSVSAQKTMQAGEQLVTSLTEGVSVALFGELGAGKTVFVKGMARGLGIREVVQSPTFVLMKVYPVKRPGITAFVHIDCYRLGSAEELEAIGAMDYLTDPHAIVAIEWAERVRDLLPQKRVEVSLTSRSEEERLIRIRRAPAGA